MRVAITTLFLGLVGMVNACGGDDTGGSATTTGSTTGSTSGMTTGGTMGSTTTGGDGGGGGDTTSSGTGGAGGGNPGGLPFGSPCVENSDCESDLCFEFNMTGPHCTIPCTDAADCPAPSTGCNGMNVCKYM